MKMNLPNRLTVIRLCMVPVFMAAFMFLPGLLSPVVGTALFAAACLTDAFDGHIARSKNLVTDFGKFLDPLADKFMVISAMLCILAKYDAIRPVFVWAVAVVVFRELAVTSIRLVANTKGGIVVPANMLGKLKTVSQMTGIVVIILEPVFFGDSLMYIPTYIMTALMSALTIISGVSYLRAYWKYLDPQK